MHISALTILFATAVLGVPTKSALQARSWTATESELRASHDQGEGFYLAIFNESGIAEVQFTPLAELATRTPVEDLFARSTDDLAKRGTECAVRYSPNVAVLDDANRQLANNANGKTYGKGAWGWVHTFDDTSFFCNYQSNYLTYSIIIDMHTIVSNKCSQAGYGFDRRTNCCGASDLAVGRTWRGGAFC